MATKTTKQMATKQGLIDRLAESDKPAKATKHHRTAAYEVKAAQILSEIKESKGKATAVSLEQQPSLMTRMVAQGLVKVTGKVMKPQRGRPAHTYGLTDKGRKMAAKAS